MNIISKSSTNPKIFIIEIEGNLTGRDALRFQEYLFGCLDKGCHYQLIDLKQVNKIDGLGINILGYFIDRGMKIRLFNVQTDIRIILRLSGKEKIIMVFDETDSNRSVCLFEEENILGNNSIVKCAKSRRNPRVNTSLKTEFTYHRDFNTKISASAAVLNISEQGLLVEQIMTFDTKTGEEHEAKGLAGSELDELKLEINNSSGIIETSGVCVWESKKKKNQTAGIRFTGMDEKDKIVINNFIKTL